MEIVIKLFHSASAETKTLSRETVKGVAPLRFKTKRAKKFTSIFMYSSTLVVIAAIASTGYHPSESTNSSLGSQDIVNVDKPSVDQIAVANLTARTAQVADLAVATDASNAAITLNVKSELAQQDETVITKPQTFQATNSGAIITYKSVVGDTVPTLAAKYGITAQTLRWANNLTTDVITPNTDVTIPTVDGVVYVAKPGDTVEAIASKYQADKDRIVSINDFELTGLVTGQKIVLPGGSLPESERPGYVAPRRTYTPTGETYLAVARGNPLYSEQAGNRYSYGNCTWYVYNRRAQVGRPIGSFWGNASSWAYAAAASGHVVTRGNPAVGDIMQNGGGAGHVAFVEEVHADGSIKVSEMNYYANGGGWNRISYRSLDTGATLSYSFIK